MAFNIKGNVIVSKLLTALGIQVSGTGYSQVKYTTLVGQPNRCPGGW